MQEFVACPHVAYHSEIQIKNHSFRKTNLETVQYEVKPKIYGIIIIVLRAAWAHLDNHSRYSASYSRPKKEIRSKQIRRIWGCRIPILLTFIYETHKSYTSFRTLRYWLSGSTRGGLTCCSLKVSEPTKESSKGQVNAMTASSLGRIIYSA